MQQYLFYIVLTLSKDAVLFFSKKRQPVFFRTKRVRKFYVHYAIFTVHYTSNEISL